MGIRILEGLSWPAILIGVLTVFVSSYVLVLVGYFLNYFEFESWSPIGLTIVTIIFEGLPILMGGTLAAWRVNTRFVAHGVAVGLLYSVLGIITTVIGAITAVSIQLGYFRNTSLGLGIIGTSLRDAVLSLITSLFLGVVMGWLGGKLGRKLKLGIHRT